jgi:hypothetical protein
MIYEKKRDQNRQRRAGPKVVGSNPTPAIFLCFSIKKGI